MGINVNGSYKEVSFKESGFDKHYRNPLTKQFQYEFALYEKVSELFESVRCRSMNLESLRLYFLELPHAKEDEESSGKRTQESLLDETAELVRRDVIGNITFPMMNICAADSSCIQEKDGTHTFIFTDGIYGFSVRLNETKSGHPKGIEVKNLMKVNQVKSKSGKKTTKEHAAHSAA